MNKIITRFAPSPTGYIHIGNVRSAIYPYLAAKQSDGRYILRIEDTDQARFVEGATELIEDTLKWLGLNWDEGPEKDAGHGPYFQSQRKEIYQAWAKKLIEQGRAYADPTDSDTIQRYRDADNAQKIPYLYRNHRPKEANLSPAEIFNTWQEGTPIRFKADPKPRTWHDEVMGDLHAGPEAQDDIILIKKDGLPTYNFAHIVDDFLMGVNMVARGVEYLSSTPNYLALYEAFNIKRPLLVSLPHILAPTGNKKLGKRDGAKSVTEYRNDGILPEAMLNYLACLGWNDGTEQEIYTKEELIKKFSLDRIQNSGARYDEVKLLWVNGQWIRKLVDEQGIDAFFPRTAGFWPDSAKNFSDDYKKQVLAIIYDRLKTLSDLKNMTDYFFKDPKFDINQLLTNKFVKKLSEQEMVDLLQTTIKKLQTLPNWSAEALKTALNDLLTETSQKPAVLFSLIRISISIAPFSPALDLTLNVLGKEVSLARLNKVKEALLLDQQ